MMSLGELFYDVKDGRRIFEVANDEKAECDNTVN